MIETLAIGVGVATVKAILGGIKEAAHEAKEAFEEVQGAVEAGADLASSMGGITKFFSSAGKYEERRNQLAEAQAKQDEVVEQTGIKPPDYISDSEYVLEMMALDRQIKQHYEFIKDTLTWQFSEPGLWAEFNTRLNKLRSDREAKAEAKRRAETEKRLAEKAAEMKKRRKKAETWQLMENTFAVILGVAISASIIYGVFWMFKFGGKL